MAQREVLGTDPMDGYSIGEARSTPRGLGQIITVPVRALPEKPGRSLMVLGDDRSVIIPGFNPTYSYVNTLWQHGNKAGDHYHLVKREIFTVLYGICRVLLKDPKTGMAEKVVLSGLTEGVNSVERLYIPEEIAHTVIAFETPSILHVLATAPNSKKDEIPFVIDVF